MRLLVAIVFGWNMQCALIFLADPIQYTSSFMLTNDLVGITVIRSIGLLFLMWNIPYLFAAIQPIRWRICLIISLIQQVTGVLGEIWILSALPSSSVLHTSIMRFVVFDTVGLGLLAIASALCLYHIKREGNP
jgi:hypothetical protein